MDKREIEHIKSNQGRLNKNTICNVELLTGLEESKVLSNADTQDVWSQSTALGMAKRLYEILQTRTGAFQKLLSTLKATIQTGAYTILREYDSKFQHYGAISVDMNQMLGTGRSGTKVYRGMFDNLEVAVKVVMEEHQQIHKEVNILRQLGDHENIVRYFMAERDIDRVYIALELCLINLEDEIFMRKVKPDPIYVLISCTIGMAYLHRNEIIHRDLKPANILLNRRGQVKISDFGLTKELNAGRSSTSASGVYGTTDWLAPEILCSVYNTGPVKEKITVKADVFSLGCIYYYVLTKGEHLFGEGVYRSRNIVKSLPQWKHSLLEATITDEVADNPFFVLFKNISGHPKFQDTKYFRAVIKEIIKKMISRVPAERPSADEILTHECFSKLIEFPQRIKTPQKPLPITSIRRNSENKIFTQANLVLLLKAVPYLIFFSPYIAVTILIAYLLCGNFILICIYAYPELCFAVILIAGIYIAVAIHRL